MSFDRIVLDEIGSNYEYDAQAAVLKRHRRHHHLIASLRMGKLRSQP